MALSRAYPSEWGVGEILTSAQLNTMDANSAGALDRRAGQGDILMSVVVGTGTGRILSSVATGPDADITWHPNGGNQIVRIPTLTAARSYTVGHTGATGGDRMLFYVEGTGPSPSGYVDIKNNVGTGLVRLGSVNHSSPNMSAEEGSAEIVYVGSGWQLLRGAGPGIRVMDFTETAQWVCPPGVHSILGDGYGGGGGGGAGTDSTGASGKSPGGGGGGGSIRSVQRVGVVPLRVYDVTVGVGGSGISETLGGNGNNGGDTTIAFGGVNLAVWRGAAGGGVGTQVIGSGIHCFVKGGASVAWPVSFAGGSGPQHSILNLVAGTGVALEGGWCGPGWGGRGVVFGVPTFAMQNHGMASVEGNAGGWPGFIGSTLSDTYQGANIGGGPGGGGGGGPGGAGATGGSGGMGSGSNATERQGTGGSAAAANSGAGGGGGGGAGGASTDTGGVGGAGGSGKLTIMVVK